MNHVDGEIRVPVFPVSRLDADIRATALNAAVAAGQGKAGKEWVLSTAKEFENYLRGA
jgi:hypothetical protein